MVRLALLFVLMTGAVLTHERLPLTCKDAATPPQMASVYISWSDRAVTEEQIRDGRFSDEGFIYENGVICDPILFYLQDSLNDEFDNGTSALFISRQAQLNAVWPPDDDVMMLNISLLQENTEYNRDVEFIRNNTGLVSLAMRGGIINDIPLHFFDRLSNLTLLDLSGNNITHLRRHVFKYLSSLSVFVFSGNRLMQYPRDLFCDLPRLFSITMHNVFMDGFPHHLFSAASLRHMNCSELITYNQTKLVRLSRNHFPVLRNSSFDALRNMDNELQIAGSNVVDIQAGAFNGLSKLNYLFIDENEFIELPLKLLHNLTDLAQFVANNGKLRSISVDHFKFNPSLWYLSLSNNCIDNISGSFSDLGYLQELFLSDNCLTSVAEHTFAGAPHLRYVDLVSNKITHIEKGAFFNLNRENQQALSLHLSHNLITELDPDLFHNVSKLTYFSVDHNKLSELHPGLFAHQGTLKEVYLGNNNMFDLPCTIFSHLEKLEILDLSWNRIDRLCSTIFQSNSMLTSLNLSDNDIDTLTEHLLTSIIDLEALYLSGNNLTYLNVSILNTRSQSLQNVTLGDNPWNCSCELDPLVTWVSEHALKVSDADVMVCNSPTSLQGRVLVNLTSEHLCKSEETSGLEAPFIAVISVLGVLFIVLVTLVPLVVYFRREIEILVFVKCGVRLRHSRTSDRTNTKRFDAFVSFSEHDLDFVLQEMMPKLETEAEPPFKLCVHFRDFALGAAIAENISSAVEDSHRTIILLSRHFLRSNWCHYEFAHAHQNVFNDSESRVIVVLMEDIKPDDVTDKDLRLYLNTHTYLERSDRHFWKRLLFVMPQHRVASHLVNNRH